MPHVRTLPDGLANVAVSDHIALCVDGPERCRGLGPGTTTIGFEEDFQAGLLTPWPTPDGETSTTPPRQRRPRASLPGTSKEPGSPERSVEIRPSQEVKILRILNEFPQVPVPGGVQAQLGDANGDERCRVVFELRSRAGPLLAWRERPLAPLRLGRRGDRRPRTHHSLTLNLVRPTSTLWPRIRGDPVRGSRVPVVIPRTGLSWRRNTG